MATVKKITPLLNFSRMSDADLLTSLHTVYNSMNGNPSYTNPIVDMATFKTNIDSFVTLVADAADGGKRAISAKNKQRHLVVKMLEQLGRYVQSTCNDDPAIFSTSGFTAKSTVKAPPQPLTNATLKYVDRGPNSGQIDAKPQSLSDALHYEIRYAVVNNGTPGTWASSIILTSPKATTISNLTPGTTYAFQIRAMGRLGYTDWSDSTTFICA
jgi:hypothetical protein